MEWSEIKAGYLSGQSISALARESGKDRGTITRRRDNENWDEELRQIKAEIQQKTREKIVDTESEINAIKAHVRLALWQHHERLVEAMLEAPIQTEFNSADIRRIVQDCIELLNAEPDSDSKALEKVQELIKGINMLAGDSDAPDR